MRLPHTFTSEYQEAARILQEAGYTPLDSGGSILSPLYVKGGETLYLYSPVLDETYVYAPHEGAGWEVNVETGTIYHPRGTRVVLGERVWAARDYETRPLVFGTRDAAEHLGLSESAIRAAMYRSTRNPLTPTQKVGGGLVFSDADLYAWAAKRRRGLPPSPQYRTRALLSTMSREHLVGVAETALQRGEISLDALRALLERNGWTVEEGDTEREVLAALRTVPRGQLVDALAK